MPDEASKARSKLEADVLGNAPRLAREDRFRFACHPGVPCFGDCCGDVNIVLTPYDVLRLKNRLGIDSGDFLERYTILPFTKDQRIPAPLLRMGEDGKKSCPFLGEGGCTVYEDRPWACRMYPLGYASPGAGTPGETPFWFLMEEPFCRGHEESRTQAVGEYLEAQGIPRYDEWGDLYKKLAVDEYLTDQRNLEPREMEMFFLATFELDRFRRFVFESTFLQKFDVPEEEQRRLREDDEELLRFGFRWLMFSLFRKPTMTIRKSVARERES